MSASPARSGASGSRPCSSTRFRASTRSSKRWASSIRSNCRSRFPRSRSRGTAITLPCRCSGTRMSASGSRRLLTRLPIGATPTSRRRSTPSSTISRAPSRPTAISTAGTTGASLRSAGRTCATTTSSITPGHLLEGAVAYFRATGRRKMLDIMERYVDHIAATFGRGPGQKRGYPGHQEIELALVKLYRLTGDRRRTGSGLLFHRRAGQPAALFHRRGARARRRSGELLGWNL